MINPELLVEHNRELELKKQQLKEARIIKQKEYRDNNTETIATQKQKYYEENKQEINDYKKEWYNKNKEAVIARVKLHSEQHREEKLQYYKDRYQKKKLELSIQYDCPCGSSCQAGEKVKHLKTAKHKAYEESIKH